MRVGRHEGGTVCKGEVGLMPRKVCVHPEDNFKFINKTKYVHILHIGTHTHIFTLQILRTEKHFVRPLGLGYTKKFFSISLPRQGYNFLLDT